MANQPIREALQIASRLGGKIESPDADQGQANKGQDGLEGERRTSESGPQGQSAKASDNPKPTTQNPKSTANSEPKSSELGTNFVPASPDITAKQIAGPEANAAADKIAAAMKTQGKGQGKGEGKGEGESETPGEGTPSATSKKGGGSKSEKSAKNEKQSVGELEKGELEKSDSRGKAGGEDAVAAGRAVEGEAWFARLPPSVQAAIQAKTRGKAPRGYEERLRRYFDGVD